jgi:hypothetical protein
MRFFSSRQARELLAGALEFEVHGEKEPKKPHASITQRPNCCIRRGTRGGGKMTGRIKVKKLMQKQGLRGEVVSLFVSRHTGIIHGR